MRFYAYVMTTAVFLSAYLLFVVQPMVGKYLLPLLGGGPSVWNTAMLFFQVLLLGGYAYAHGMARFVPVRSQYIVHLSLFALAALSLPLALTPGAEPTGQDPRAGRHFPDSGGRILRLLGARPDRRRTWPNRRCGPNHQ